MIRPAILSATILLAACAQGGSSMTSASGTRFGSTASCQPTNWISLERQARSLPSDRRQQFDLLMNRARNAYSDFDRAECMVMLQQAERLVGQGTP